MILLYLVLFVVKFALSTLVILNFDDFIESFVSAIDLYVLLKWHIYMRIVRLLLSVRLFVFNVVLFWNDLILLVAERFIDYD